MKLTLLHKGLILVSIPLCFEVTIFGYLLSLQVQVEHEAQRVNRNKRINDEVNYVIRDVISMNDTLQSNSTMDAIALPKRIDSIKGRLKDISDRIFHLRDLAKDDPQMLAKVEMCSKGMTAATQDMLDMGEEIRHTRLVEIPYVISNYRRRLDRDAHYTLSAGILDLGEESLKGTLDDTSSQMREQTRLLLKCALGFSVLFALIYVGIFGRHLVSRLSRLSINAQRLAQGEPLLASLGGSDEVAELDRTFHYAAELIEAAKKMRQEVTAMITHDLKTPLQSIRSYLEMLEAGLFGQLNEQGARLLTTTENASEHMVNLIDSVLQLEKLRTGSVRLKTEAVALEPLLNKCIELVKGYAEAKGVAVEASYNHPNEFGVTGDPFWLQEVFVNILSNGVKFTPEKSKVTIATRKAEETIEISIADQGPGIPEAELKLIFDRFHRVESTANVAGSGLGLSIAKELLTLHNGSIDVQSEIGKGSAFIIRLPVCKLP
jgi:signal transduction histidine kinase